MLFLYRILSYLAFPLVACQLVLRILRDPAYKRRIPERFGYVPHSSAIATVWIHAVSAGEVIAVSSLIEDLIQQFPKLRFLVTTTTPAGSGEILKRLGEKVSHTYAPYDLPRAMRRFVKRQQPAMLLLVETELWPNLIDIVTSRGIPVHVINARLSEKSSRGYARVKGLTRAMLNQVSTVACQYPATAQRFTSLGAAESQLEVTGSVKFDLELPQELESKTQALMESWCFNRPTWIAASTHSPEEKVALEAHQQLKGSIPDVFLILVPRHPPRTPEIQTLCAEYGFTCSTLSSQASETDVLIVDQMGVLLTVLGMGSAVFIGGSLQGTGGHNPIEPASRGIPMFMGPDRHNFEEICSRFAEVGALPTVHSAKDLVCHVKRCFDEPEALASQTNAALEVINENRGAKQKLLQLTQSWIMEATDQKYSSPE